MHSRKVRLLALHGKGTSARIMKSQIKPIIDLLGDVVEVHYMDGGEISAPYQGKSLQSFLLACYSFIAQKLKPNLLACRHRKHLSERVVLCMVSTSKSK